MKVTFKLAVDPADQVAVTLAIQAVDKLHQERVAAGEAGHYYFNSDQYLRYDFDTQGDLIVSLEGERCPLVRDGLIWDFKQMVAEQFGSTVVYDLTLSQRAFSGLLKGPVNRNGVECLAYETSDSRLNWDHTLADWYTDNPEHSDTVAVFNKALWVGDIHFAEWAPHGHLESGHYTATEEAAVRAVGETLNPDNWKKHAELVRAFHDARAEMLNVIGK